MIIDDVKRLSATMTPKQLERHFATKFKDRPRAMLHAHGMADHVARTKAANARTGELRTKVREFMKTHPDMPLHQAYRRVGSEMGIL